MSHYLYRFSKASGEGEFVVISDELESEVVQEYAGPGIEYDGRIKIADDATSFPCDRELRVD
jgi:hypothetical protein